MVAVGVAVGAAFGEQLRPLAKQVIKAGLTVADQVQRVAAEAYERGQDLIAEARKEREQESAKETQPPELSTVGSDLETTTSGRRSTRSSTPREA